MEPLPSLNSHDFSTAGVANDVSHAKNSIQDSHLKVIQQLEKISPALPKEEVRTSINKHTWRLLPQTEKGKLKFEAAYKILTMFQTSTSKIIYMLGNFKRRSLENLKMAGVLGNLVAFSACSYYAFANFSEAVHILQEGGENKYSNAAKKVAVGLATSGSALLSLSSALMHLSKAVIIPVGTLIGTVATLAGIGIGPIIIAVLEGDKIKHLRDQANTIRGELESLESKLKAASEEDEGTPKLASLQKQIEIKKFELESNIATQRFGVLKIVGALLYSSLQVSLAVGTMGGSMAIFMAISLAFTAGTMLTEYTAIRQAEARKALIEYA